MTLIETALKYIADGFPVIPLCWPDALGNCGCGRNHQDKAIGKVPLVEHGLKDATITQQGVRDYWRRWSKANIGIVIPSGVFVLDIDVEHNGFESLAKMEREHNFDLTQTWLVTTGGGGQHYYYKTDKPIRNTARMAGYDGMDIRGTGGYVVAPPSLHRSGERYKVSPVWDGPITLSPAKLIDLCLKPITTPLSPNKGEGTTIYLEGQRNDTLTRDAGAMRRRGLSEEAIYAALQVTNQERCQPPLPDSEIRLISKSIGRYAPDSPKPKFKAGI